MTHISRIRFVFKMSVQITPFIIIYSIDYWCEIASVEGLKFSKTQLIEILSN